MESSHPVARASGFDIPISGAIAEASEHFLFTVTMGELQRGQTFSLTGDESRIDEIPLNVDQLVHVDGTIFGEYYDRENINSDTCLTTGFNDYAPNRPWARWQSTSIYLDLKTADGDLMIGQNGLYRQGGEIYYGNWKDLGEIQGYFNGVGLILPKEKSPGKVLISDDFLQSWTEQDLNGKLVDAVFFKDHWHVLADLGGSTKTYSFATPPPIFSILEDAQLKVRTISGSNYPIPGCNKTATTGLKIILPGSSEQLYQIHTSRNLEGWTAYGLPMAGGISHFSPISSDFSGHPKTFFRANEIEIQTDD